jgi:hypothetical protein
VLTSASSRHKTYTSSSSLRNLDILFFPTFVTCDRDDFTLRALVRDAADETEIASDDPTCFCDRVGGWSDETEL